MNGLIIEGCGEFALRERRDLRECVAVQAALATAHGPPRRGVYCLCRYHEGIKLAMYVFQRGLFYVGRNAIADDHAKDCIFRRPGDGLVRHEAPPASTIFDPPSLTAERPVAGDADFRSGNAGDRYLDFAGYVALAFSRGYTSAWAWANRDRSARLNPTAAAIFAGIQTVLTELPFRDAANGEAAAHLVGARLVFGLIEGDLPDAPASVAAGLLPFPAAIYERGQLAAWLGWATPEVVAAARQCVQIYRQHVAPPYLMLAVVEPDGRLRRLALTPVYFDGFDLAFARSGNERRFIRKLLGKRFIFYKPLYCMREYERLQSAVQAGNSPPAGPWPYTPDAIVLTPGKDYVAELRGFDLGEDPGYDELMKRKGRDYPTFLKNTGLGYTERHFRLYADVDWRQPRDLPGRQPMPRGVAVFHPRPVGPQVTQDQ
jgi:hypothetical protein